MRKLSFLWILASGLLLVGCSGGGSGDSPEPPPTKPETPTQPETPSDKPGDNPGGGGTTTTVEVSFTASLAAFTRSTETTFESGDRIGVFAMEVNPGDNRAIIADQGNFASNIPYVYNGSRFVGSGASIKKETGKKLFYAAIYPYVNLAANSFEFDVQSNQSTPTSYAASDLSTATTEATDATTVGLNFIHRMAKVVLNLSGTGWTGNNISVKMVDVFTKASVNMNNQTFVGIGAKSDVICSSNGTKSYKVLLPPQPIRTNEKIFVVTMDGVEYSADTQTAIDLQSGKSYEFTLTLNSNGEIVIFTGDINPWNESERINEVVPEEIQDKIEPYIPIYHGATPPNIEGTVFVDPFRTVYCEDYGNGGYAPGHIVNSEYIRFSNQNMINNTLDMDQVSVSGNSSATGKGAFISGTGNNFTVFFNTVGQSQGISTKTALIISGTKTVTGIANLKYAFVMVDKGSDPNNKLMKVGIFRVFEDQDGLSQYTSWPAKAPRRAGGFENQWTIYSNIK